MAALPPINSIQAAQSKFLLSIAREDGMLIHKEF
jgi:hypothetical protein